MSVSELDCVHKTYVGNLISSPYVSGELNSQSTIYHPQNDGQPPYPDVDMRYRRAILLLLEQRMMQ